MEIIATFVPRPGVPFDEEIRRPPAGATWVEVRADLLPAGCDLAALLRAATLPVLLTLRSRAEGGQGPDEEAPRRAFFTAAASLPAALVDLEAARDSALLGPVVPGERAVLSSHVDGVPPDLDERLKRLLGAPARLVKLVATARTVGDLAAVLRVGQAASRQEDARRRAVIFAAGEVARVTRLLGPLWCSGVAFAAWDSRAPAAPGQLLPEEMLALTGHLEGPPERLFAIVGQPVAASLSPRMHSAAYRALGLPYLFAPLEVASEAELDAVLQPSGAGVLAECGIDLGGFAVTMPWKTAAARRCTVLAPRAARARAVNTVLPRPGKVLGDCTDIDGVRRALLDSGVVLEDARALVLGSGGAARAAAVALDLGGARVALLSRDAARGRATAAALGVEAASGAELSRECSILVNATPAGARGEPEGVLETLQLPAGSVVVDLPYAALPTGLETLAARRGWRYVSGREVLLWQGVSQLAAMTSAAPPVTAMAAALGLPT